MIIIFPMFFSKYRGMGCGVGVVIKIQPHDMVNKSDEKDLKSQAER